MVYFISGFARTYPRLAEFAKSGYSTVKSWECGRAYIPASKKCWTDPVSGRKLPKPLNYQQYSKARAIAWKKQESGQPLNETEKILAGSVIKKKNKINQAKVNKRFEKAARSIGVQKVSATGIAETNPHAIAVDPKRFQYKIKSNSETGSVGSLKGVKKYDKNLGGILQVWHDPKVDQTFAVNGHNRLNLAKRDNAPSVTIRFLDVKTAKEARAIGALTNIAEGRGTAQDAAKFFKDSGLTRADLDRKGIPLREKIAQDGLALANLSDELFNQVVQGKIPEQRAVVIGSKLKDKSQQKALVQLVAKEEKRGRRITNDVISELADMTSTAPKQVESSNQLSLLDALGFDPEEKTLAIEKAQVTASIKRKMTRDKKLFSTVGKSKAAQDLQKGGNRIDVQRSKEIAEEANTTLLLFDKVKGYRGEVDTALNEGAKRLANGDKKETVIAETYERISASLQQTYKYGEGQRSRRSKSRDKRKDSQTVRLSARQENLALFAKEYPGLAKFAKEKGWRCGKGFISWRAKCYTNPKTGQKLGYKYIVNPKTGRRKKVRVGLTYSEYKKARTKAIKKQGQGEKLTSLEQKLVADTKDLAARTRKKKQRSSLAKKKRLAEKEYLKPSRKLIDQLPSDYLRKGTLIQYMGKVEDIQVNDDSSRRFKVNGKIRTEKDVNDFHSGSPFAMNRAKRMIGQDPKTKSDRLLVSDRYDIDRYVEKINKAEKGDKNSVISLETSGYYSSKDKDKKTPKDPKLKDKLIDAKSRIESEMTRRDGGKKSSDKVAAKKENDPAAIQKKNYDSFRKTQSDKKFLEKTNPEFYEKNISELETKLAKHNSDTEKGYKRGIGDRLSIRDEKRAKEQLGREKRNFEALKRWVNNGDVSTGKIPMGLAGVGSPSPEAVAEARKNWVSIKNGKKRDNKPSKEKQEPKVDSGNQMTLGNYKTYRTRLNNGDINAAEVKTYYEAYKRDRNTVLKSELEGLTKKKLAPMAGYMPQSERKEVLVRGALDQMDFGFVLDGSLSHGFSEGARERALDKKVEDITDDKIQERATEIKERRAKLEKSIKNPETIEEFQTFVRYRGKDKLSTEQRTKYDDLIATRDRGNRQVQEDKVKAEKATAKAVDLPSNKIFELKKTVHAKKGIDLYVAAMTERVDKDKFYELKARAKKLGGYYSRYNRDGAIPGFQFEDEQSARSFAGLEEVAPTLTNEAARTGGKAKTNPASKLINLADRMEARANEKLNADRKVNTARRARMAAGMESDARESIRHAQTIRNIATGINDGEVQFLDKITASTQVSQLEDGLIAAKHESARRKSTKGDGSSDYKKRERESHSPITDEDIAVAKYPYPSIHKYHLSTLADEAKKTTGLKQIGNKLAKDASLIANSETQHRITYSSDRDIENLRKVTKRLKNVEFSTEVALDAAKRPLQDYDRLQKMGIKSSEEYRAALREYNRFRAKKGSADPIKQKERDLIGLKIDGYFPTPKPVVDKMIDLADLKQGQRVLEPSAGKGNIAEAIQKEVGKDNLETIEIDYRLSDILTAKGFNTRKDDFLSQKEGQYDRILMNPPFEKSGDIKHVKHAYSLLAPGGKIVAITSESPFFNQKKEAQEFRQWLANLDGYSEKLPANSFKSSDRPTGVNTRIVVIEKPFTENFMQPPVNLAIFSSQYPNLAQFAKKGDETKKVRVNAKVGSDRYYTEAGVNKGYYTRTRKGKVHKVKKTKKKKKVSSPSIAGRVLGKNRAKYTDKDRNLAMAKAVEKQYKKDLKEGNLTTRERYVGKRYPNLERRKYS